MPYQQYLDPSSEKWIKFGYWYNDNKEKVFKYFTFFLIFLDVVFWSFAIYGVVKIAISYSSEKELHSEIAMNRSDVLVLHDKMAPQPPKISEVYYTKSSVGNSRLDFFAIAENINKDWLIEIDYSFVWADGLTQKKSVILLPNIKTPLFAIGAVSQTDPQYASIDIEVRYSRIRDGLKTERALSALEGMVVLEKSIYSSMGVSDVEAVIYNSGFYSILDAYFVITVTDFTGNFLGAGLSYAQSVLSGQNHNLQHRWTWALPENANITIYPVFDFLEDSSYLFSKN